MMTSEPIEGIEAGEELVFDDSLCGAKHPSEDDTTCTVSPEPNALSDEVRNNLPHLGWGDDPMPYDVHVHEGRGLISGVKHRWEDA